MAQARHRVDLDLNTVDGKRVSPLVAEMVHSLVEAGGSLSTGDLIQRLYGVAEPRDALGRLRAVAAQARARGINVRGTPGRNGGRFMIAEAGGSSPLGTSCSRGHEFAPENTYLWTSPKTGRSLRQCRRCRKRRSRRDRSDYGVSQFSCLAEGVPA